MTNETSLLKALSDGSSINPNFQPQNNKQAYLAYLCGLKNALPEPRTVEEILLYKLCINGTSGNSKPEQEKSVYITENGTTEIVADKGYLLSKVTINANVKSSGTNKLPQVIDRSVTELTAEDFGNIKEIGWYAFYNCTKLGYIEIPNTVQSIRGYSFKSVGRTTTTHGADIYIPISTKLIGASSFEGAWIKNVYYGGNIGDWCKISFSNIDSTPTSSEIPTTIYFKNALGEYESCPANLTLNVSPNKYTFVRNAQIVNLTLGENITKLNSNCFRECPLLETVSFPNTLTTIETSAFYQCTSFDNVIIPNSVTTMEGYIFAYCSNLTNVRIGNGITSIGTTAFANCPNLTDIYIDKPQDSVSGAPWGASNATVHWNTPLPSN